MFSFIFLLFSLLFILFYAFFPFQNILLSILQYTFFFSYSQWNPYLSEPVNTVVNMQTPESIMRRNSSLCCVETNSVRPLPCPWLAFWLWHQSASLKSIYHPPSYIQMSLFINWNINAWIWRIQSPLIDASPKTRRHSRANLKKSRVPVPPPGRSPSDTLFTHPPGRLSRHLYPQGKKNKHDC